MLIWNKTRVDYELYVSQIWIYMIVFEEFDYVWDEDTHRVIYFWKLQINVADFVVSTNIFIIFSGIWLQKVIHFCVRSDFNGAWVGRFKTLGVRLIVHLGPYGPLLVKANKGIPAVPSDKNKS